MYEFKPSTDKLLSYYHYVNDSSTGQRVRLKSTSPPLGMNQVEESDSKTYDKYINKILDHHFPSFLEICFLDAENDFQKRLLALIWQLSLHAAAKQEADLLRDVFRLIIVTYIMGHTISMDQKANRISLAKLSHPYREYHRFTTPRLAHRQLKYLFSQLQRQILSEVLRCLQNFFHSSVGGEKWTTVFAAVLGLAMTHEENQKTMYLIMDARCAAGEVGQAQAENEDQRAVKTVDDWFGWVIDLFRAKYTKGVNPLTEPDKRKVRNDEEKLFVANVKSLVDEFGTSFS